MNRKKDNSEFFFYQFIVRLQNFINEFNYFSKSTMDKYTWRQVKAFSSSSHKPSSRWGHSCCVVGEDIVFFGGYADSNYMNDVWAFNQVTMKWRQIDTKGDIPTQRSNCSMNYDKQNNQIVIFGGGGSNKQRFNAISILNWSTKQWIEICPKQNEVAPWERTYHAAELIFPFLVVFGGQGVADMDDLWLFNFNTLSWSEVKIPNDRIKPCARRFHSSVVMGNQIVILAGCHGKYRCLSDIFCMDFTPLLKTGKIDLLEWKEKKIKNSSLISRWGHSSSVYQNKIYIFGGRFSNDLNDILVVDFQSNSIKQLKVIGDVPAARRRHCAGFIGSSMLMFGGFNGQYFNDLHYISVHQSRPKYEITNFQEDQNLIKYLNNVNHADCFVKTKNDQFFSIRVGMILKYFETENNLIDFLESVERKYSLKELFQMFKVLYLGYGNYSFEQDLKSKFRQPIFETRLQKLSFQRQSIQKSSSEDQQRKLLKKSVQGINSLIKLNQQAFTEYYMDIKNKNLFDFQITVGKNKFPINKIKVIAKSQYFSNVFEAQGDQKMALMNILCQQSRIVYEIFFNFLQSDWLVVPDNVSSQTYLQLIDLADYFCTPALVQLCCNEIIGNLNNENIDKILIKAIDMKLSNLTKACSDFWIKKTTDTHKTVEIKDEIKKCFNSKVSLHLEIMLANIGFDLSQTLIENQKITPSLSKKSISSNLNMEKQNYETNIDNH